MARVERITRRIAVRRLAFGAAALALFDLKTGLWADAPAEPAPRRAGQSAARAVIEIWLAGGPCHLDTFDPKPDAGSDYTGPLAKPIATAADGMRIGELLPLLAKEAKRFSLVRSMTHGSNAHETAAYTVQTGRGAEERLVHPSVGSVVSLFRGFDGGYRGLVPPYVVLTTPLGRFSETGFLGPRYAPFVTGGDPSQQRFAVEGVVDPTVTDERQKERRALLHDLDALGRAMPRDPRFETLERCEDAAYDLILGDAGKLFDLSGEDAGLRERYGRNRFGQSCLMARRLVESGVPYVKIHSTGWDTHKQHFETMRRRLPELDRGLATLIDDLAQRGLLASTIVWCTGEFGRTPRVQWEAPWNGGRGHHGACFSALVAGGGFQGGRVVGATDAKGERVAERPVHPQDLHGTIYGLLGIDPDGRLAVVDGADVPVTAAGAVGASRRLRELL